MLDTEIDWERRKKSEEWVREKSKEFESHELTFAEWIYIEGAREFAEWLNRRNYFDGWYKFDGNEEVKLTTDEILSEWQKGAE